MVAADLSYRLMVDQLAAVMRSMDRRDAAHLAAALTNRVNLRMLDPSTVFDDVFSDPIERQIHAVLPDALMNYATLGLPWDAFRLVHGPSGASTQRSEKPARLVCSLPEALDTALRKHSAGTIRSGTLLDTMASLIGDAQQHIILINPYWSLIGIHALLRRVTRTSYLGVEMVILTQPKIVLSVEERHCLQHLLDAMKSRGAQCTVMTPVYAGLSTPLLHAKALVVDHQRAYLGSANITGNGMDFSVELGLEFEGKLARQLGKWLTFLAQQMHEL
jgi:phosphatidylserine/phosphatidylglycerophosphate/cardiolipin synthase-like enzyme